MTSQPGQQIITIHILHDVSRSKDNQTMKFGKLTEYDKRNISIKNHAENEAERLVPDLFLYFRKVLFEVKVSGLQLSFNIYR